MGHNIRNYRIPPGALIKVESTIYGATGLRGQSAIRTGQQGLVLEHRNPAVIIVFWLKEPGNPESVTGVSHLGPDCFSTSITGWTDAFTVISLPEGRGLETW